MAKKKVGVKKGVAKKATKKSSTKKSASSQSRRAEQACLKKLAEANARNAALALENAEIKSANKILLRVLDHLTRSVGTIGNVENFPGIAMGGIAVADAGVCTITLRDQMSVVVISALERAIPSNGLTEQTSLSDDLGLSEHVISLLTIPIAQAVEARGCQLGLNTIVGLDPISEIVDACWEDIQ